MYLHIISMLLLDRSKTLILDILKKIDGVIVRLLFTNVRDNTYGAARDFTRRNSKRFTAMFTPGYAPLEQYGQALKLGTFTDIYALGATLYHLLTGEVPISAVERAAGIKLKSVRELNPQVSPHVSAAISKALAMEVQARSQSVQEFLALLQPEKKKSIISVNSGTTHLYEPAQDPWNAFDSPQSSAVDHPRDLSNSWF